MPAWDRWPGASIWSFLTGIVTGESGHGRETCWGGDPDATIGSFAEVTGRDDGLGDEAGEEQSSG